MWRGDEPIPLKIPRFWDQFQVPQCLDVLTHSDITNDPTIGPRRGGEETDRRLGTVWRLGDELPEIRGEIRADSEERSPCLVDLVPESSYLFAVTVWMVPGSCFNINVFLDIWFGISKTYKTGFFVIKFLILWSQLNCQIMTSSLVPGWMQTNIGKLSWRSTISTTITWPVQWRILRARTMMPRTRPHWREIGRPLMVVEPPGRTTSCCISAHPLSTMMFSEVHWLSTWSSTSPRPEEMPGPGDQGGKCEMNQTTRECQEWCHWLSLIVIL